MSKQISFSNFLEILEEYENVHASWCYELIENGRKTLQSVYNHIDEKQLMNLMDSFIHFVSLLSQCHSHSLSDDKNIIEPKKKQTLEEQTESQDLLSKNDIIKIVNNELQCPICNEWLFKATSANCNHTFCKTCIKKWLKINKTCPICRTTIQYTSTSIAIDNFISNLCQLVGGFFKERRESIQNANIDDNMEQTNADYTIDDLTNDLSLSQLVEDDTYFGESEDDTYISELENTLSHPNMVRLIPHPQSPLSVPRLNSRPPLVTSNSYHPNRVQLSYPRPSIINQRDNQPTSSSTVINPYVNRFLNTSTSASNPSNTRQPVVNSSSPHPNTVQLSYPPQLTTLTRFQTNRLQPTSTISAANPITFRANTNISSSSRN